MVKPDLSFFNRFQKICTNGEAPRILGSRSAGSCSAGLSALLALALVAVLGHLWWPTLDGSVS